MRRFVVVAAVLTIVSTAVPAIALAEFALADWQYAKEVQTPPVTQETLVELHPDAQLYDGSSPGLTDLRIIAEDAREAPHKLEVHRGSTEQRDVPVTIRDQGYVQGQYNTFTAALTLEEGVLHNRVSIQTDSINFQRTVVVRDQQRRRGVGRGGRGCGPRLSPQGHRGDKPQHNCPLPGLHRALHPRPHPG